jgi:hypothetical protein
MQALHNWQPVSQKVELELVYCQLDEATLKALPPAVSDLTIK